MGNTEEKKVNLHPRKRESLFSFDKVCAEGGGALTFQGEKRRAILKKKS